MLLLLISVIRLVLVYSLIALRNMFKTHQVKLKRIQLRAFRTSLGLMTSTHIGILEVLSEFSPLDLRWKYLFNKHRLKRLRFHLKSRS